MLPRADVHRKREVRTSHRIPYLFDAAADLVAERIVLQAPVPLHEGEDITVVLRGVLTDYIRGCAVQWHNPRVPLKPAPVGEHTVPYVALL